MRKYQYDDDNDDYGDYDDGDGSISGLRESYSSQSRRSPQPPRNINRQYTNPHPPPGRRQPHRPSTSSAAAPKMRIVRGNFKQQHQQQQNSKDNDQIIEDNNINHILDGYERMPREALISSLMDTKKKLISMESLVSTLKAENQRWENEISKQQKRIDKLLDSSVNRHGTSASDIRKELEKSTLVRQLKRQNNSMRNNLIDKDIELEKIKKSIKGAALMIISNEKDEYYMECIRLKDIVSKLIEENKIYKHKLKQHGKEDEEIRREVVRLSSGFQSLLESAGAAASSSTENKTTTNPHKKGSKHKEKQILSYFNSDVVTQDDGILIVAPTNEITNATVPSTPTSTFTNKLDKSKDIFDITPSTPFPLLNHGSDTSTPVIIATATSSSSTQKMKLKSPKKSPPKLPKSPSYEFKYKVGSRVQGQYKNGVNWYDATIKAASNKGEEEHYHLLYDDGDEEKSVVLSNIRLSQQEKPQSPSKQLFDKYLDDISDDDNLAAGPAVTLKANGQQHDNNDYDDDFEA